MKSSKIIKLFVIFVLPIFIASECSEKYIRFEEPVPSNKKELDQIPNQYQGSYRRQSLNYKEFMNYSKVEMIVLSYFIIKNYEFSEKLAKEDFDTMKNLEIRNNLIYDLDDDLQIGFPFYFEEDSLVIQLKESDTVFNMKSGDVAKQYKNSLYLNNQVNELFEISKLQLDKNKKNLAFFKLNDSTDVQTLKDITAVKDIMSAPDSAGNKSIIGYVLNLTKKDLKKLIKKDGFNKQEKYQKIK